MSTNFTIPEHIKDLIENKKILLVEDDSSFRKLLKTFLEREKFEVREAENGLVAKTILELNENKFDLVISDIKMPQLDGVELLEYSKRTRPNLKFIVMTGFAEILESQEAHELGADGFLPKPFEKNIFLLEVIELLSGVSLIKKSNDSSDEKSEGQMSISHQENIRPNVSDDASLFRKIHIDEFTQGSTLSSDIYIKVNDGKFIKVAREGTIVPVARISVYKEKRVNHLFVHRLDFKKYLDFNLNLAKVINKSNLENNKKIRILKHSTELILEDVFTEGIDADKFDSAKDLVTDTLHVISQDDNIFALLESLESHADFLYAHSVAVSTYATLISKEYGWESPTTLFKLAMSGLFHDIGKKEIDEEILNKPRVQRSSQETAQLETHASRGKEILSTINSIPNDVIQIVYHHHENELGTGYPQKLNKANIHPLAKVVALADSFCNQAMKTPDHEKVSAKVAIDRIYSLHGREYEKDLLVALMKIANYPIPDDLKKRKKISA
ncbi:MAG: response regulator [Bdellovibrionales bacterium]|nr:response regulator [Bdellovibrionales bacterium]